MQVAQSDRSGDTAAANVGLSVSTPVLDLGGTASGDIAKGQNVYYRLNVPPGSNVELDATFGVALESDLLVKYAAAASEMAYDLSPKDPSSLAPQVVLPAGQGGPYYILLHGNDSAGAGEPYTLQAIAAALTITGSDITAAGNSGPVIIHLTGTGFTSQTTVSMHDGSGHSVSALSVTLVDSGHITVAFDLTNQTAGNYTIDASNGAASAQAPGNFQVTSQSGSSSQASPYIQTVVISPASVRVGEPIAVDVTLTNDSTSTVMIPLSQLTAGSANLISPSTNTFGNLILPPHGMTGFGLLFDPQPHAAHVVSTFSAGSAPSQGPLDLSNQVRDQNQPPTISTDAWDAAWTNLTAALGSDFSDLDSVLATDKAYFAQFGETVTDDEALAFELAKADDSLPSQVLSSAIDSDVTEPGLALTLQRSFDQSISGRYRKGLLGQGWTTNWDFAITTDSSGDVTVQEGTVTRQFTLEPEGNYAESGGCSDTLTMTAGAYNLREANGTLIAFYPDNQFNYIEDQFGNTVTAGYRNGVMAFLEASNGDRLNISYNSQGHITQTTQPDGQTVTYTYDSSGNHLIAVTNPYGKTQYSYVAGKTAAEDNALASITNADGTHLFYTYDSQGRLIKESGDGGAGQITFGYLSPAGYTITDAAGNTTTVLVDLYGQPAQVTDAKGNVTRISYNANGQPVLQSHAGGESSSTSYDQAGRPILQVDPLGNATHFAYDSTTGALQSVETPSGGTTSLDYNNQGNLQSVTTADGNTRQLTTIAQAS